MKLRFGFTLAEVLITLGIIGIVAAMTIPTLLQNNYEKQTITKLRQTQSILAQAIRMAQEEYGDISGWDITGINENSAKIIANNLKPFLKIATDCGVYDPNARCTPNSNYKQLNGSKSINFSTYSSAYKIVLLNGIYLYINARDITDNKAICFTVDTNGKFGPNTYGIDTFMFLLDNEGKFIEPAGLDGENCSKDSTGFRCTNYVLRTGNMNYLHKK